MAVDEEGQDQKNKKIGCTGQKAPEKASGFCHFSGDNAGDEADEDVNSFDAEIHLCFGEMKFVQGF